MSVTTVGASNIAAQVSPQSRPAGSETTEPAPFPISDTASSARIVTACVRIRVTEVSGSSAVMASNPASTRPAPSEQTDVVDAGRAAADEEAGGIDDRASGETRVAYRSNATPPRRSCQATT